MYDYIKSTNPDSKKVLFIIPGVTCNINEHHIKATCRKAYKEGYNVIVVNPVAPPDYQGKNLEVIEYHNNSAICEHMEDIRTIFGQDSEIYALGFSLGSNHLLRHLGSHENCKEVCGIKAAASISGAFELPANSITLRKRLGGIYDYYMASRLRDIFRRQIFKRQTEGLDGEQCDGQHAKTMLEFDTAVRGRMGGYNSGHLFYRKASCNAFIPSIEIPTFVLYAKDDTITDYRFVPIDDLARNENIVTAVIESGGHCDLFYEGKTRHKELAPKVILNYFEKV